MKIIIDIPQDHKRVIDNLVSDGKDYLLPYEVERRLAKAVKIGTVIPDNATNGDIIKVMFPNMNFGTLAQDDVIVNKDYSNNDEPQVFIPIRVWYAPYRKE